MSWMAYTVLKRRIKTNKTKNPVEHLFGGILYVSLYMLSFIYGHSFFSLCGLCDDKNVSKKVSKNR